MTTPAYPRAIHDTLRKLDDRALHILGVDRSELRRLAMKLTEEAEHTRARALPRVDRFPK
jgi:hypothetical protein